MGTTYQLTIPESSSIVEKVSVGEEGWNYGNYSKYSYFEDENGANVYVYYLATDRVVIQAANGVKRVYVIAYAQDDRGVQVAGITDEYNQLNSSISIAERPTTLTVTTEDGESEEKEVYVIGVVGGNKELGSTYELTIPEGSKIVSTNHSGTEAWKYEEESTYVSYVDALGNYKNEAAVYTDEVVIQAPNGAERTYLIAYLQDSSAAIISGIQDDNDETITLAMNDKVPTEMNVIVKDENGAETVEKKEVYVLVMTGANESLGTEFSLEFPEGSTEVSRIYHTQEEWNYQETGMTGYYGECIYECEVVVRASNGAERTYLIAYAQVK